MLRFDNRLLRELPGDANTLNQPRQVHGALWSAVQPTPVRAPRLLAYSREMARTIGIAGNELDSPQWLAALAGNALLPGMASYATCYGGHQFGQWADQLGDGRAIYLGEAINSDGQRFELQLKGAGPTPYSRFADGRAVLRSSIREFLCSEAMHHLGVPTTRALALVATGEHVVRDMFYDGRPAAEPGAIVCRVAPSFTRFGHFELLAARGDKALLQQLVDFTIARDFPELATTAEADRLLRWFVEVCERTASLMVHWLRVGFVHGVMNTDNMSILGLTIDYGPYGWIDNFDPAWTPNTTDATERRYCFARQPEIARWNLERLAEALTLIAPEAALGQGLARYDACYNAEFRKAFAAKFGLAQWRESDVELVEEVFALLHAAEVDMTLFFRRLAHVDVVTPDLSTLHDAFYQETLLADNAGAFAAWLSRWAERIRDEHADGEIRVARMNAANPSLVLRNYLAQQAIERAESGDASMINELLEALRQPYVDSAQAMALAGRRPEWARRRAGCSMLSCSS